MIEFNLLKLSNLKLKASKLKEIIIENKDLLEEKEFFNKLIANKILTKEQVLLSERKVNIKNQIRALQDHKVKIITVLSKEYPEPLKEIEDAPPILYCKGNLFSDDSNAIAIIGTRKATDYGRTVARNLAKELSERGITIISGLASGIDTQAHLGALLSGGRTIAVMGTGIDFVYPPSNRNLAKKIVENGALLTELPPNSPALPYHFPSRNRIISALSKAVIVVEASLQSGVFSTVRWALEYGKDVYAVPGDINRKSSMGTNELLKNGAFPLTSYEDLLNNTKLSVKEKEEKRIPALDEKEQKLFEVLNTMPKSIDLLVKEVGYTPQVVIATLASLEIKGLVRELPGKRFIKEE
ncbi:MAG: DNA-processing protein DprA [candidate division WOR-3 bacterium]